MLAAIIFAGLTLFVGLTQTGIGDATRVRGTVTSGAHENRPIAHALVVAVSDSYVTQTQADGRGRYVFLTLLPGVYRLTAIPGEAGNAATRRCAEEELVELSAGVEYLANLDLTPGCK